MATVTVHHDVVDNVVVWWCVNVPLPGQSCVWGREGGIRTVRSLKKGLPRRWPGRLPPPQRAFSINQTTNQTSKCTLPLHQCHCALPCTGVVVASQLQTWADVILLSLGSVCCVCATPSVGTMDQSICCHAKPIHTQQTTQLTRLG